MGNRISAVNGVRSPNLYAPGNAVNEIWFDDVEIISRLPFGDSPMAQAGWPKDDYPKIPWRPFIIPLRAAVTKAARSLSSALSDPAAPSSSLSPRSLPPPSPPPQTPSTTKMLSFDTDGFNPWCVVLLLSVPFLLGPIILYYTSHIYSRPGRRRRRRRRTGCLDLVAARVERETHILEGEHHAAIVHAFLAQALGDLGIVLMYGSMLAQNNGNGVFRLVGAGGEFPIFLELGIQLLATISRGYLLCIWYKYFKAQWHRDDVDDEGAGNAVVEPRSEKSSLFHLRKTTTDVKDIESGQFPAALPGENCTG